MARKGQILSLTEKNEQKIYDFFDKALELEKDEPYIWYLKSIVHTHYLEHKKASESFEKALSLVSESKTNLDNNNYVSKRDLLLCKIGVLIKFNKYDQALKCCESLLKSYEHDREAFFHTIGIYFDQEQYEKALDVLKVALNIDPNLVYFLNLKGIIYSRKKCPDEALKIFKKITVIDPDYEWGWSNQLHIYYYQKEYKKTDEIARRTLEINPKNASALYWGAMAMRKLGNSTLARRWEMKLSDPNIDTIFLEKNLQDRIADELWRLKKFGYNLNLKNREYVLKDRRRIDLLCEDVENHDLIVIELKVVQATKDTYLQISHYMDSISKTMGLNRKVKGIIISSGYNEGFKKLIDERSDISQFDIIQIGL